MKVKYTALLITLITVGFAGSLQAQMTFAFSDNGSGTTLITASGSTTLTGNGAFTPGSERLIGWDNTGSAGTNNSFALLADSGFFTFNEPNIGGGFAQFAVSNGDLTVDGVALEFLEMDGTNSSSAYPYFALGFTNSLPQTGSVTASGSAVVDFNFLGLPYFGQTIDLQNKGEVLFEFAAIPEPTTVSLLGLSALAGVMLKRHRTRTNKKDVIPSKNMVEKW